MTSAKIQERTNAMDPTEACRTSTRDPQPKGSHGYRVRWQFKKRDEPSILKLGAMNSPFKNVVSEIKDLASMGFSYVELSIEKPHSYLDILATVKREILSLTRSCHINLLGHISWVFDLETQQHVHLASASYEYVREMEKVIQLAHELEMNLISIHPPLLNRNAYAHEDRRILKQYIIAVDQFSSLAEERGCTICVENVDEESFSMENFEELFREVPNLGFTLDVGHANIGTIENSSADYLARFGQKLQHMHISDNLGGYGDLHLPIGAGIIDFDKIFDSVHRINYDRTMTLEVFSRDRIYLKISKDKVAEALRT